MNAQRIAQLARRLIHALEHSHPDVEIDARWNPPCCGATCGERETIDVECECGKVIKVKHTCQAECSATLEPGDIEDHLHANQSPEVDALADELRWALDLYDRKTG